MTAPKSALALLALSLFVVSEARAADPDPVAKKPAAAPSTAAKKPAADSGAAAKKPAEPESAEKKEAAARFDRGLELFDQGDNAGALAEFKRTYELMPNPVVQYNLGLVYAAMGRPVEAVDALEPIAASTTLSAQQRERAQKTLAEQQARIGRLAVTTTPEVARIEVDGVDVAKTPLTAPIRLPEGSHVVSVVAEGFSPSRKEVLIASNADTNLHFDLVATEGKRLANLTVRSRLAGAEVLLDGQKVGQTPLETSLPVAAGHHKVELRRPGYLKATQELDVDEGGSAEVELALNIDSAAQSSDLGSLELKTKNRQSTLFVDGASLGPYSAPVRLPRGPHHIRLEVAGFQPYERDVTVDPSQSNVVEPQLEPTAETIAAHDSNIHIHRTLGWIGVAAGAVIAGAGTGFLVANASTKQKAQNDLNTATAAQKSETGQYCDIAAGADFNVCNAYVASQQAKLNSAQSNDLIGYVGIGLGSAVLITGVVLLFTGDDPHEFDHSNASGSDANRMRFAVTPGPGNFGAGLALAF
ncbi:MAG TPA: PEGA domain-containing protein [Polyangiaceae bacterium]|nr:PEGA domain-containing protein [Polyangiaceae bacterium]